ncbi:hypothetical protein [Rufibacter tibetensis]|uniref:hypothetical protein n=1 Tax=Rufibacter tibetensis TaxID=512763 RepID=UPI000AB15D21|nr:hypothetical protein [Rufibacter tibetensis]
MDYKKLKGDSRSAKQIAQHYCYGQLALAEKTRFINSVSFPVRKRHYNLGITSH